MRAAILRVVLLVALLVLFVGCVDATGPMEDPCASVPWRDVRNEAGELVLQVKDCSGRIEYREGGR